MSPGTIEPLNDWEDAWKAGYSPKAAADRAWNKRFSRNVTDAWPPSLNIDALHGIAGEIVRAIEPHTEADPVAILLQLLAAFGNAAGRHAYMKVEGDRHPSQVWPVLVGPTAKGRKGSSWSRVRELMALVDPD